MTQERSYKQYQKVSKEEASATVLEQGYSIPKANSGQSASWRWAGIIKTPESDSISKLGLDINLEMSPTVILRLYGGITTSRHFAKKMNVVAQLIWIPNIAIWKLALLVVISLD